MIWFTNKFKELPGIVLIVNITLFSSDALNCEITPFPLQGLGLPLFSTLHSWENASPPFCTSPTHLLWDQNGPLLCIHWFSNLAMASSMAIPFELWAPKSLLLFKLLSPLAHPSNRKFFLWFHMLPFFQKLPTVLPCQLSGPCPAWDHFHHPHQEPRDYTVSTLVHPLITIAGVFANFL